MTQATLPRSGDRVADAWQWLTAELQGRPVPPVVAIIGPGDGAVFDALQAHAPGTRVLALEPDAAAARAFVGGATWRRWRQDDRLAYLSAPDYAGAEEAWRLFTGAPQPPPVLLGPGLQLTPEVGRAAQVLKKILVGVAANQTARRKFAPRYLVNSLRNLPAIVAGSDIRHLQDACRGVPAVVVAAGPSLDAALARHPDLHERAFVVACDTALRPLLLAGVEPHLAVGVDPGELNARHLSSLPHCPQTWLVAESALDRTATAAFDGRTFWFHVSNHEPWPWFNEAGLDVGRLDVWGSVLTAAFQVALLAGCDPIVIVGADLAFTDGRPYARGTTCELDWSRQAAGGATLEDVWRREIGARTCVTVPDLHGRDTTTTPALLQFRDWLAARIAQSGRRVVNASGAGILAGQGIELGTVDDVLSTRVEVPSIAACAKRHSGVRPTRLAAAVREAHTIVAGGRTGDALYTRWRTFSGDGFDARAVADALDEAARGLERRYRPASTVIVDWRRIADLPDGRTFVAGLPEAVARLHDARAGASLEAEQGGREPRSTGTGRRYLAEALRLLAAWSRAGGTATADERRWALAVFDGLLGRAWGPHRTADGPGFYARPVVPRDRDASSTVASVQRVDESLRTSLHLIGSWLQCAASLEQEAETRAALLRLTGLQSAVETSGCGTLAARLQVQLTGADRRQAAREAPAAFELSVRLDPAALGRLHTGVIGRPADDEFPPSPLLPFVVETVDMRVSFELDRSAPVQARRAAEVSVMRSPCLFGTPGERWSIAYPVRDGVICVRANDRASRLVRPDGANAPFHEWPRPIVSELPLGEEGAVAWGTGRAMSPLTGPYVMYRRAAGETPVIEDLPFVPTWGAWWNGRLYWSVLPAEGDTTRGLGSWAPGEGARIEAADGFTLFDIRGDADGLILEPSTRRVDNSYARRRLAEGWRWHPVSGLVPVALGPYGAAGYRSTGCGWTVTTRPEADLVELEHEDGTRLLLTVYHPFRAAWAGTSLLVGTVDQQLLRFDDFVEPLDRLRTGATIR